jgi:hypothetical protein
LKAAPVAAVTVHAEWSIPGECRQRRDEQPVSATRHEIRLFGSWLMIRSSGSMPVQ